MKVLGLVAAKRQFSKLIARAERGETIGITRYGELVALVVPADPKSCLKTIFADATEIRRRAKIPAGTTIKELIEWGRE